MDNRSRWPKIILLTSLVLNFIFFTIFVYIVHKKGGMPYLKKKGETILLKMDRSKSLSESDAVKLEHPTHYYLQKSIYESLPNNAGEIIFLGDSITDFGEWSELFDSARIKNRGIGGDRTDGVLGRLNEMLRAAPDKIFLMIGYNDLSKGVNFETIISNYRKIIQLIRTQSPETRVYVQSVLPVNYDKYRGRVRNTDVVKLNQHLKDLSIQYKAEYIDLFESFRDGNDQLSSEFSANDGLHINGKAYLEWKSIIKDYVNN